MTIKRPAGERFSLARWSRRKLESHAHPASPAAGPAPLAKPATVAPAAAAAPQSIAGSAAPLPPVESLTFDSDFTAFLRPEVDPKLQRAALKQLFRHPRFNVMDGLDVYIDDYTRADPIPPDMLAGLVDRFSAANEPPRALGSGEAEEARASVPVAANAPAVEAMADPLASSSIPSGRAAPTADELPPPRAGASATPPAGPGAQDASLARSQASDTGSDPARDERR
jgi:hypothetical protein